MRIVDHELGGQGDRALRPIVLLTVLVMAAALLFGGGARRGLISDLVPQLLAIPLLLVAASRAFRILRDHPLSLALLGLIVLVPVLHLIPLPASLWTALPGREDLLDGPIAGGFEPPFFPLTIQPRQGLFALLSLVPALAIFCATLTFSTNERVWLAGIAIAVTLISAPIAMLQLGGGPHNPFYFFEVTNNFRGVGFFANANHYAALNYCMIPLAAALVFMRGDLRDPVNASMLTFLMLVLLAGLALSLSRSAFILGGVAVAAIAFVGREHTRSLMSGKRPWVLAVAVFAVAAPLALGLGLVRIMERFGEQGVDDARWTIYLTSLEAARAYFPFGAGVGGFERAYQLHEPLAQIAYRFVNHAHNDWIELLLEAGVFAAIGGGLWLVWLLGSVNGVARLSYSRQSLLARAALCLLFLLSIHSLWDYPLRTIALSSIFAFACACSLPYRALSSPYSNEKQH